MSSLCNVRVIFHSVLSSYCKYGEIYLKKQVLPNFTSTISMYNFIRFGPLLPAIIFTFFRRGALSEHCLAAQTKQHVFASVVRIVPTHTFVAILHFLSAVLTYTYYHFRYFVIKCLEESVPHPPVVSRKIRNTYSLILCLVYLCTISFTSVHFFSNFGRPLSQFWVGSFTP